MKADRIIKGAKIFTADEAKPLATALVVKDGKFIYVGDEAGLADFEGDVEDLGGKFVMPAIIDSHVHVTTGVGFEYVDMGVPVLFDQGGKQAALDFMAAYVRDNPGLDCYRFNLERADLDGEEIAKEDLDAISSDSEIVILEGECHSNWVNSKVLDKFGITDETPDPVPGLAYFVRKDGHVTGNSYETASWPILFDSLRGITDEQIDVALERWVDYSVKAGVSCVFDAGFPEHNELHERMYARLRKMDREGRLPVYIDGCYVVTQARQAKKAIEELRRMKREFDTEHLKVHTFKIFMDGTLKIETAAMVTPYEDTGATGATALTAGQVSEVLKELNKEGLDFHVHTVGEASSRVVLDGVELAKRELGDDFKVKVTCAHLWVQDDADLSRFAELGVTANFSPWWHSGNIGGNPRETWAQLIGEKRADAMWRCKTLWDTGALVTWSSDEVFYGDFSNWSPYFGMEIGMTRWIRERTACDPSARTVSAYPADSERMSIEEMILGYTINGAKQLGIEDAKGSITAGKDADFLVFDQDLTTAEKEGFSHNMPSEVYFGGTRMK
jgi:predicted amidohydrolase YtcJ